MEVMVTRLCALVGHVPAVVTLHIERILSDLGRLHAPQFVSMMLPYMDPSDDRSQAMRVCTPVRLLAMHVIASVMELVPFADLLDLLPTIALYALPSLTHAVVDIRQAVICLLVEVHLIVGDELLPHIKEMSPSQKKLLNIYIDRKVQSGDDKTKSYMIAESHTAQE
jgi:hypothetical protein